MVALAAAGAAEGVWVRADQQTGGRGRQGRSWVSPPGNLYASTLIRLCPGDPSPPTLALVAAVALAEAVGVFGVDPEIKWPNDLLVDGAKLSGILLERSGDAVIVGFGVNLAHHPVGLDRPVTSLTALTGTAHEPAIVLDVLADSVARWLSRWRSGGIAPIRAAWLGAAHTPGTPLSVKLPDGDVVDGLFDGLDADGALKLRLADGGRRVIHAGDVFVIPG